MNMKNIIIGLLAIIAFTLSSCSDKPEWADPEAHEKTEQLRKQYTTLIVGTWHYERISEKQRVFEQLTFKADGTFSGLRKWQTRQLVTIGGEEQYTDWEDIPQINGTFAGTWSLRWERNSNGVGENRLDLYAKYDNKATTICPTALLPFSALLMQTYCVSPVTGKTAKAGRTISAARLSQASDTILLNM